MTMQSLVIEHLAIDHRASLQESASRSRRFVSVGNGGASRSVVSRVSGWFKSLVAPVYRPAVTDR